MDRQEQEPGPRASEDDRLKRVITTLHTLPGWRPPGVCAVSMLRCGCSATRVGRKRVWRVMRELGLQPRQTVEDHHHTQGHCEVVGVVVSSLVAWSVCAA